MPEKGYNQEGVLRILIDEPQAGPANMAVDESILEGVNRGESPATLRFYQWLSPTISLGYFQKYEEFLAQEEAIRRLPVVRRQTGGGAILHNDELTYSLILPLNMEHVAGNIAGMYQLVHDVFIEQLLSQGLDVHYRGGHDRGNAQRGPFFCFARTHRLDLVVGNDKLLGSAQRRIKNAALQHGSLILRRHFPQQPSAEVFTQVKIPFDLKHFSQETAQHVAEHLSRKHKKGELSKEEISRLTALEQKYRDVAWNHQSRCFS